MRGNEDSMMTLITGGSGSGKSAYAEDYIQGISKNCHKYYIATMQVFDEEGMKKINRHREMRNGKGFETIEQPVRIEEALKKMKLQGKACGEEAGCSMETALLECMSNLAANEMFSREKRGGCEELADRIIDGVKYLNNGLKHLVIVTNNVFEDGILYDEDTMEYIRLMALINRKLTELADCVTEVVVGIPVMIKKGK